MPGMALRATGAVGATTFAIPGLVLCAATVQEFFLSGSGGVALPFVGFWAILGLLICWVAAGILMLTYGSRGKRIALWSAVGITALMIILWFAALPFSQPAGPA